MFNNQGCKRADVPKVTAAALKVSRKMSPLHILKVDYHTLVHHMLVLQTTKRTDNLKWVLHYSMNNRP